MCNNTKIVSLTHDFEIENVSSTHDLSILKHLGVYTLVCNKFYPYNILFNDNFIILQVFDYIIPANKQLKIENIFCKIFY